MNVKQKSMADHVPNGLLTLVVAALLLASIVPIVSAGWGDRKPVDALMILQAAAEAISL